MHTQTHTHIYIYRFIIKNVTNMNIIVIYQYTAIQFNESIDSALLHHPIYYVMYTHARCI